jgi:signal peptidase I
MHAHAFRFLKELAGEAPVSMRIAGDCMEPLIASGATISVRKQRFYLPGDVIVFRTPAGDIAAHRLLGYRMSGGRAALVTKGDRCTLHDAPVPLAMIVGAIAGVPVSMRARLAALSQLARIVSRKVAL